MSNLMLSRKAQLSSLGIAAAIGAGLFLLPSSAMAVAGACVNCHTMHNSQDGAVVAAGGPYDILLTGDCISCHTGTNDGLTSHAPYVFNSGGATYNTDTLAGGDFYWVSVGAANDAMGHNVAGIAPAKDATLASPPGYSGAIDFVANQIECAGAFGCHGDTAPANVLPMQGIAGSHHGNIGAAGVTAGAYYPGSADGAATTLGTSYRFLDGVYGIEDINAEYTNSAAKHNQYMGEQRTAETQDAGTSISSLCGRCHDVFHKGAGNITGSAAFTNPWVRHPTDLDMGLAYLQAKEYADYGGAGVNDYMPETPVASDLTTAANQGVGVVSTVFANAGDAIVTCVSCHRAHGSPYQDMLRWSYSTMVVNAAAGAGGCFNCHTTKDAP